MPKENPSNVKPLKQWNQERKKEQLSESHFCDDSFYCIFYAFTNHEYLFNNYMVRLHPFLYVNIFLFYGHDAFCFVLATENTILDT